MSRHSMAISYPHIHAWFRARITPKGRRSVLQSCLAVFVIVISG